LPARAKGMWCGQRIKSRAHRVERRIEPRGRLTGTPSSENERIACIRLWGKRPGENAIHTLKALTCLCVHSWRALAAAGHP
jgi:hypothetical protein